MRTKRYVAALLCALALLSTAALAAAYSRGSTGETVKEIQRRLSKWGYYSGNVDGVYGSATVSAVKLFQKKNGLTPDGVCGKATLAALGISEKSSANADESYYLLARMIAAEARGEPYVGQVAVGAVILNRVRHASFPNTVAGVIYQSGAFTAISDGQFKSVTVTAECRRAASDALSGWDPTGGAVYYYNPAKTTSAWIYSRPVVLTIGKHVFAK
ncbi:MAG: spore cortex-lytic enzyme [Clostridia bacterium]|nr:spore cortex-lytic enzyme [Clostridia bacterium]